MISIVLGSSFGDEGKGSVVSKLIGQNSTDLVIRFNGGHQVGHTVVHNGVRHVFSNFGSGSLQGVPTYWSSNCTVHPLGIINEYDVLMGKGCKPTLYVDPLCPVVTPFDIQHNRSTELSNNHGSVGVGFGATVQRNEDHYHLYAQDLIYDSVTRLKLQQIMKYYNSNDYEALEMFMFNVAEMLDVVRIGRPLNSDSNNLIFEGGQGILLDQDFGFFPHVTRSNTTCKNAMEMINSSVLCNNVEVIYVTRPYLTRHGNGPLPFEDNTIKVNNHDETNVYHEWQKGFRYAPLNIDLLNYSVRCDSNFAHGIKRRLWVTCADQVPETVECVKDNKKCDIKVVDISKQCGIIVQTTTYQP